MRLPLLRWADAHPAELMYYSFSKLLGCSSSMMYNLIHSLVINLVVIGRIGRKGFLNKGIGVNPISLYVKSVQIPTIRSTGSLVVHESKLCHSSYYVDRGQE